MASALTLSHLYIAIIAVLVIALGILIYIVVRLSKRFRQLTSPVYDQIVSKAEQEAKEIRRNANEEAQALIDDAQKKANEYVTQRKEKTDQVEQEFRDQLQKMADKAEQALDNYNSEFAKTTSEILDNVEQKIHDKSDAMANDMEGLVGNVREDLGQHTSSLKDSLTDVKDEHVKQVREMLQEELEKANKAVDEYRAERMQLIDHEMATLVEKTTQLTLQRTLSADDHADIVKAALEDAKEEGVFGDTTTGTKPEAKTGQEEEKSGDSEEG